MNYEITSPVVGYLPQSTKGSAVQVIAFKSENGSLAKNLPTYASGESSKLIPRTSLTLEWQDLNCSVSLGFSKGTKRVIKGISGKVCANQMTAVMGPSGAGKTTLMNVLAGYKYHKVNGSIRVNGVTRDLRTFRKLSCYIMQDNNLVPNLTVHETMVVAANLKLPSSMSYNEKNSQILEILETLGLANCQLTKVQRISGGQRKRLCIAQELVSNPPIIFLDEPTSGLDSSSSYQCLVMLKKLAMEGRTVVCTIHQPSAKLFELFDKLYMLADGMCMYNGNVSNLVHFLRNHGLSCPSYHNPADYATEIASGEFGEAYLKLISAVENGKIGSVNSNQIMQHTNGTDLWLPRTDSFNKLSPSKILHVQEPDDNLNHELSADSTYTAGFWVQFTVLFMRSLRTTIRDGMLTQLRLAAHLLVGILLGAIYRGIGNDADKVLSNSGCLFFSMLFLLFASMMPTVLTFPMEMKIFLREHLNHWYTLKAYYLAKTMADLPFQIIFPMIYGIIVYWMTSQPSDINRFLIFLLLCVLVALVSQSLGIVIGMATNIQNAVFLGPITSVPMLLFSGFFVHLDTIPPYLRWLSYFSYIRYAFEGSLICIYGMSRPELKCDKLFCAYEDPQKYLEDMDIDTDRMKWYYDALGLFIFFIVVRIIGYFVLRMRLLSKRGMIVMNCHKYFKTISKS